MSAPHSHNQPSYTQRTGGINSTSCGAARGRSVASGNGELGSDFEEKWVALRRRKHAGAP